MFFTILRTSLRTIWKYRFFCLLNILGLAIGMTACINYINFDTAKATKRAKEIGVRKINGARFGVMFRQISYMMNTDLGYNPKNVVYFRRFIFATSGKCIIRLYPVEWEAWSDCFC